jgi:hypothetical protein
MLRVELGTVDAAVIEKRVKSKVQVRAVVKCRVIQ